MVCVCVCIIHNCAGVGWWEGVLQDVGMLHASPIARMKGRGVPAMCSPSLFKLDVSAGHPHTIHVLSIHHGTHCICQLPCPFACTHTHFTHACACAQTQTHTHTHTHIHVQINVTPAPLWRRHARGSVSWTCAATRAALRWQRLQQGLRRS